MLFLVIIGLNLGTLVTPVWAQGEMPTIPDYRKRFQKLHTVVITFSY